MKLLAAFFSKVYQYVTAFIVVGSPLFFVPYTAFSADVTYQITMIVAIAVALTSYVISALLTKSWHTISKLEFLSYNLFSLVLLGSVVFARNPQIAFLGDAFGPYSAASLIALPVVMYLVRALPEKIRHTLKIAILGLLGLSGLLFITLMIFNGKLAAALMLFFAGFSNAISLTSYLGVFVIMLFLFTYKTHLKKGYKTVTFIALIVILAWILAITSGDGPRPNLASSISVGKSVLLNDGVFGIGAGGYARAWQLYRPSSVIMSPYFSSDFEQGFGTTTTFLTTIGIFGLLSFLLLTFGALYSTYRSYKEAHELEEKRILGILTLVLAYFSIVAWLVPLSYAMLITWMAISGLGLARARLTIYHPNKKMAYLLVPLSIIYVFYAYITVQKARAFMMFAQAQSSFTTSGPSPLVEQLMSDAARVYPYDGFYRSRIEYIITLERSLVATRSSDPETLKTNYLAHAQEAVDAGLSAVKLNANNYQNYVSLGRAYELAIPFDKEGGYSRAKKSYEEAIKLYPENPYLYVMVARLEAQMGSKAAVRTELAEALKKKENFADALYLMSQLEASEQNVDQALAYALEAVKNAPNDPLVYIQSGLLYYGKKDYQNAVAALQVALQKDPNNSNIAYFLALSLRDGGRPDLAKQIGEELLRRNPGNADLEAFLKSVSPVTPSTGTSTTKTPAKKK